MDPDALWKCLFEALIDLRKDPENPDTRAHAIDCLNQLSTWLYRKGFAPDVLKHLFDTMDHIEAQLADEEGRARKGDF
jgi:hypothetical protein